MDAGGGGGAVAAILRDPQKLLDGDIAIYEEADKENNLRKGFHALELINFQAVSRISDANHNLLNDFESRRLLFPKYRTNPSLITGTGFNPLEDIYLEIIEAKNEISCIQIGYTQRANEQFILI